MTRLWYLIGLLLLASGLAHLGVLAVTGGPWDGPVSFRKPFTFGISFGVSVLTLAWVAGHVRTRWRNLLLGAFATASTLEVALITMQAWRGVPSHFNQETAFDALVSRGLAIGGGVLIAVVVAFTVAAFRPDPDVSPSMRLAVRAGFVTLLAAMAFGGVMIARGMVEVATGNAQLAYTVAGSMKPAHAVLMHGLLLLPALAALPLPEARRLRLVRLACLLYGVAAAAVSVLAALGITAAGPSTASVLCAGAVSGLGIGALAWTYLDHHGPRRAYPPSSRFASRSNGL
ncbi:hypothetical protein [Thermoactinospora rubra]|uniref:hypothetical protein n=1 Tax=Thermoactinospora rubra TaxID=1088767 RepID=UPI00197D7B2A|nr:hypothetical protein [Thermoactinospora rubra]